MTPQRLPTPVWDRLARERGVMPLDPERLRTLLVIVPAASGDVALATTIVRYVKSVNPDCRITFATRRANIPLVKMCPGVGDTIELPTLLLPNDGHSLGFLSRRKHLQEYGDYADAVVYTCPFPEDVDLLTEYGMNSLEAVRLLAGVPGGMTAQPQRVWLETPLAPDDASSIIGCCLGPGAQARLALRGIRRLPESLAAIARTRSLKGSGLRVVLRDLAGLKNIAEILHPLHKRRLAGTPPGRGFALLSTEATSLPPPPRGVIPALVGMLRAEGRTVLHNVRDPLRAAAGTVPLVCSYAEFLCLRTAGIPFVGWRSGLCDIAAAAQAPMCVLCPPEHEWCRDILATHSLRAMGIAPDCLEIVCRSMRDLKASDITDHLFSGPER